MPPPAPAPAAMRREQDELESLKQLVISPHMVTTRLPQAQQLQASSLLHSPSPSPLPSPHSYSDEEDDVVLSPGGLYEQPGEPSSGDSEGEELRLTRTTPISDLSACGDVPAPRSPLLLRAVSAVSNKQRITGEALLSGGLYGAMDGTMTSTMGGHRRVARQQTLGAVSTLLQERVRIIETMFLYLIFSLFIAVVGWA